MRLSHTDVDERIAARADEFRADLISEPVFRASLFALGKRGNDLDFIVREHKQRKFEEAQCAKPATKL